MTRPWQRPAIFGAFDGITCCLGVILSLTHDARLILPAAAGVAAVVWLVQLLTPGGGA